MRALLRLKKAWGGVKVVATPLPDVWKDLKSQHIQFRRGQVCMVAAAPNAGKSMFALIYAIKAEVPTLFFSADTDVSTVMIRVAAHLSGHSQLTVEKKLNEDPHSYDRFLPGMERIQWVFDSSPNLDDIEMEVKAYVELFGVFPELIIVDNLMNVVAEHENEWAGLRDIMMNLHDLARKTEACVLVLHHVSEANEYGSPTMPSPRRAVHGKISQLPAVILTLGYDPSQGLLRVAPVKNRFGPHYADASRWATLFTNFECCAIGDSDAQGRAYLRQNAVAYNNYGQQTEGQGY